MILYGFIFILLLFMASGSIYSSPKNVRINFICFILIIIILWALSWLRWERGTDWGNYKALFDYSESLYLATNSGYEYVFGWLNYTIRGLTSNYSLFLLVEATILYFFIAYSINKNSCNPLFSIFSLFCINLGFIFFTRQFLSISIVLYSFNFIVSKQPINFFILVCVATSIHMSSAVFVLAYWLYYKRFSTKSIIISVIAINVIGVVISLIVLKLISTLPNIIGAKISFYLDGDGEFSSFGQSPLRVIIGGLVNKGGLLLLALYVFRHNRTKDANTNGIINLYCAGYILFMMTAPTSIALTRVAFSYDIMYVYLLPLILMSFRRIAIRKQWLMLLSMYLAFRFFYGNLNGPYGIYYVPYNTLFTKEIPMNIG